MRIASAASLLLVLLPSLALTGCTSGERSAQAAESKPAMRLAAADPFQGLPPPTPDPSATPYRFETGPRVPKPDNEVSVPFPPATNPKAVKTPVPPPLKVLRTQPTGNGKDNEALIGAVTATFNQPMIPLAALSDVKQAAVPMTIDPLPAGRFRWLGTTTVSFEPEGRMPFATHYTITVPAGAKSALGQTLAAAKTWSFDTPRAKAAAFFPSSGSRQATPDTVIGLMFNQKVDPKTVLEKISLVGPHGHVSLEIVPASEWASIKGAKETLAGWEPTRSVVYRPKEPLEKDGGYTVTIAPGLTTSEGPLPTTKTISWGFRTYAPLKVTAIRCGWDTCDPGVAWQVEFNNPLDGAPLDDQISIKPAVEDLQLQGSGNVVELVGSFKPATTYTVTVAAGVADIYGQTLAEPVSKSHKTRDAYPQLDFPAQGVAVSEALGNRQVGIQVENVFDVRMRMVKIPANAKSIRTWIERADRSPWFDGYNGKNPDPVPAGTTFAVDRKLTLPKARNVSTRMGLALDDALGKKKPGLLWVDMYSEELRQKDRYESPWRALIVQVTDIGLAVKYDPEKIVILATGIDSGKPLANVDIAIYERDGKSWATGKTGADGMLSLPGVRNKPAKNLPLLLTATNGDDVAFLQVGGYSQHGYVAGYQYAQTFAEKTLHGFVFSDRGIYRPEETVHLKGIVRERVNHPGGELISVPKNQQHVSWSVRTPRGDELTKGEAQMAANGTFVVDVALPRGADLGWYYFTAVLKEHGGSVGGNFQVQEYRTPEYKVSVDTGKGPWFFGQTLESTVHGAYYFGAPLAGAEARWTLSRSAGFYAPPNNDGFSFGNRRWGYGWELYGEGDFDGSPRRRGWAWSRANAKPFAAEGVGHLDDKGDLAVKTLLEREKPSGDPKMAILPGMEDVGPGSFTLEATVFDKNRQAIANRSAFVVHPADVYVGMRTTRSIIKEKERIPVEAIAASIDGTRVEKDVAITVVEEAWKQTAEKDADGAWHTKWTKKSTEVAHCSIRTGKDPKGCDMTAPRAGGYVLRGTTKDSAGREATTSIDLWVYGEGMVSWRLNDASSIELVPDRTEYKVGDVAKVLVKSPFPRGEGLLSFEADGMLESKHVSFEGSAQVVEVPLSEKELPNVTVSLALARGRLKPEEMPEGAKDSEDLGRPAFATGAVSLKVSLSPRTIKAEAIPSKKEVGPGESVDLAIKLSDENGKPVSADTAVFLVDEGVLALLGYRTPDPLSAFYPTRGTGTALEDLRENLLKQEKELKLAALQKNKQASGMFAMDGASIGDVTTAETSSHLGTKGHGMGGGGMAAPAPDEDARAEKKPMALSRRALGDAAGADKESGGEDGNAEPMTARTNFASTAFWAGSVATGADGKASLSIKLPDNLTTYRIMVVAEDEENHFGNGEAQITVHKRLLVRPSLPRFLNYGDSFEAAMVVHNETEKNGDIQLIARGVNVAFDEGGSNPGEARKVITLKAHESKEVRFKAHGLSAGPARVQFGASFDGSSDAAEITIPIKLPATGEAFATYGTTETSIAQPVLLPSDAIPEYGALDVQTSSTALGTLGDAVDYLYDYPYECLEQTASRILPIVALKDIIKDFHLGDKKTNAEADKLARDGIQKIASLQGWDGGFKLWPESQRADPWSSGYATFVLLRAKEAKYDVPEQTMERAKSYLLRIGLNPPRDYDEYWRRAVQVQSLLVLTEMGEKPEKVATELYDAREKLPFFSRAQLLVSLSRMDKADPRVAELLRLIDNAAVESPSTAHYAEQRTESLKLLMHSESRSDAMVLWAMLEVRPTDTLIPKVVKGLNDSRVKGRWLTTQENAWVILAMSRYYHSYEKTTPQFVARTWLEDRFMGESAFKGRSFDTKRTTVPLGTLVASIGKPQSLVISKDGPGRLYYRLGLTYAPKSLELLPEEQGFSVARVYEPVADKGDVVHEADGSWSMKAGSTVRVRLTIVVPDRAYYAAITDPLPAGLEAVNTALQTTAQAQRSGELNKVYDTWSWYSFWAFDHIQMRDDRVEIFANTLPAGVYEYTYLARATTYGKFVVPPLKAEEMYAPEVFGRNGTARVTVK